MGALIGAGGWFWFTRALVESRWFPGQEVSRPALAGFAAVMVTAALGFHALLEGRGTRATFLAVILIGIAPVLIGSVIAAANRSSCPTIQFVR